MSDLASRLVQAAAEAIAPVAAHELFSDELDYAGAWRDEARAAVAATLRALASEDDRPMSLYALADVVERGETSE